MQKIILCKGLPGSGKSYFAKALCEKDSSFVRINRDDLRNMRGKYWQPKQEYLITDWEESLLHSALLNKLNVILDDTNLNPKIFNHWMNFISSFKQENSVDIEVEIADFTGVSLKVCIERDLTRPKSVGEKVIRRMYNRYILNKGEVYVQNPELSHAIICDLDGTLCLFGKENSYDRDFSDDKINVAVQSILKSHLDTSHKIIFFSGRNDKYKNQTIEWLENNLRVTFYFELHMRKDGDNRDDVIVKKEMFNEHIRDKYYVDFVLDDRSKVVDMWRSLGLTVLQCAEGNY